jgi:hypothetical protein
MKMKTILDFNGKIREIEPINNMLSQLAESAERQRRILIVDDEPFNIVGLKARIKSLRKFDGLNKLVDEANDGQ